MTRLLFTDVSVLDCTGALPYRGQVLVEGERIRQVWRERAAGVRAPERAVVPA